MRYQTTAAVWAVCLLAIGGASMPRNASAQCTQQSTLTRPIPLGVSGGNINSTIKIGRQRGCFGGTLGSMVQDADSNQYILSNNHVLADQNKAKPGQLIVQPGLIDIEPPCLKAQTDAIATFSRAIKLKFGGGKNTVDAAIAAVNPGEVDSNILNIGSIGGSAATAAIGMGVEKMGRTTCLTIGTVEALNVKLKVNYSETKHPKLATFVNQILLTGSSGAFSLPGDSGSLIVTHAGCPQPVALLFAGSADGSSTVGNPISDVLSGLNVTMVSSCTPAASPAAAQADGLDAKVGISQEAVASAAAVRDRHEAQLMSIAGAAGTGIGAGDQPGQPAIEVYLEKLTPKEQAGAPKEVEGIPVKLIQNGGFFAY